MPSIRYREMAGPRNGECSAAIRGRVTEARNRQRHRFGESGVRCNGDMPPAAVRLHCEPDTDGHRILEAVIERLGLSARAHDRILKVARTIADLDGSDKVRAPHIAEAVQYRSLDRGANVRAA